MVRTNSVKLTVIDAIAYRQKLPAGGSGIVIIRKGVKQAGIASISKSSGEAIPTANTPLKDFPPEAFEEALALTAGLPYRKQEGVENVGPKAKKSEPEEKVEEEVVVDSDEYQKIVEKYTDKNGKLSYDLLNKDLIKFAHSSSVVRKMLEDGKKSNEIRSYVVGSKFRTITGNDKLTDKQVDKIGALLDEVSPKGVFKEFNDEIRRRLKAAKK
ncbi:MAG: hypothetical protein J6X87_08380 [Clostridia bacterium]|jgi:hypothetical protein|nr:hypothetical protein [Clostridia bacterium]